MAMAILVVLAVALLVVAVYGVSIYNGLILVANNIAKAWANIDVLLKQRHDEIPKLVKICQGYMEHEKGVFENVLKAREALMAAKGPAAAGRAEGVMEGSLKQLFALAENYPNLKAQSSFQQMQERVSGLESQIADRREFYNDSVNIYNIRIASLPDTFVAKLLNMQPKEMFQVSESDKQDVEISFK